MGKKDKNDPFAESLKAMKGNVTKVMNDARDQFDKEEDEKNQRK